MKKEINDFKIDVERFCKILTDNGINVKQNGKNKFTLHKVTFTVKGELILSSNGMVSQYFSFYAAMKALRKAKAWDAHYSLDRKMEKEYLAADEPLTPADIYFAELKARHEKNNL